MRHGLLALLEGGPTHGYQLKHDFEAQTGGTWMLNIGQVYTTLQRLERDGLVVPAGAADDERRVYELTAAGKATLDDWFATPVVAASPPRDELAIKVLLAIAADAVDVTAVLQAQRTATLEQLQEYTRLKRQADPENELAWILMLDALIFKAEAEVRWLDTCEARLRLRHTGSQPASNQSAGNQPTGNQPDDEPTDHQHTDGGTR